MTNKPGLINIVIPGVLVAATGVGAGDLVGASLAGRHLGTGVLWAVAVGAVFKFGLTEGLARWQLSTGQTFLEGTALHFGLIVRWFFLPYLLLWSFFVGTALMGACGVTLHAIIPAFEDASQGKVVFGIASSLAGLALVRAGEFKIFERVMEICIGTMFIAVTWTAVLVWPGTGEMIRGLFIPSVPDADGQGITWTVALIGGVGGTLTILCYGYWIREKGRSGRKDIRNCRIDLGISYFLTALFGMAMVIIGSTVEIEGKGAGLLIALAERLRGPLGEAGSWIFLAGAFGAVFSSLLGVWQAVPYLFADLWRIFFKPGDREKVNTHAWPYRLYLYGLAWVPMIGLWMPFKEVQKVYAVIGASFIPLLAVALVVMNGHREWVGDEVNRWPSKILLVSAVVFFGGLAWQKWTG